MVEISKSGSGEGPGGVIPRGYSTILRSEGVLSEYCADAIRVHPAVSKQTEVPP